MAEPVASRYAGLRFDLLHRIVAASAVLTHMVFVAFTVIGGFVAWLAPWLLLPHVAAAAWGGRMAMTRAACPLSRLEDWAGTAPGGPPSIDEASSRTTSRAGSIPCDGLVGSRSWWAASSSVPG